MIERLKHLIVEAHRRSLWQVLGVYVVAGWITLQVVGELTRTAGLPEWVPPFALVLLLVGFPIVMATAVVQEGGPTPERPVSTPAPPEAVSEEAVAGAPSFLQRHLTWKRSLLGGVAAFGFLGMLAAGYLASWALGVGPMGSLVAQGSLEAGDRIVLADFGTAGADADLGTTVTDALRIDLLEMPVVRVLERVEIQEILRRMQADPAAPLTPELAREVALREGVKAVLEGSVAGAGSGYVLTATLRSGETGEALAPFRETARSPDDLISAIDRLSRRVRERAGESLRSIHAAPGLERVTTSSLAALRLYSEALRHFDRADYRAAAARFEEALEHDPEFAMAWRGLGVALGNLEVEHERVMEAVRRAYELRARLTERERHLSVARYHSVVMNDREATIAAYRRVLEIDADDRSALNNLAIQYTQSEDWEVAGELLQRATEGPGASPVAFLNLTQSRIGQGRLDLAEDAIEAFALRYPANPQVSHLRFWVRLLGGDEHGARMALRPLLEAVDLPIALRVAAHDRLARLALRRGRIREAREHLEDGERISRELGRSAFVLQRLFSAHADIAVGNPDRGIRLLREIEADGTVEALPPPDRWHFFRAILYGMAGMPDEAEAVLEAFDRDVSAEFHERFWVRNQSARMFVPLHRNDPEEAISILEEIRAARGCRVCYAERMGWTLKEAGRHREAAEEWESALAFQDLTHAYEWHFTQNLWVLERIGPLYEELGETDRALAHYRHFVDLWADADPELQRRVERARERIEALEGEDPARASAGPVPPDPFRSPAAPHSLPGAIHAGSMPSSFSTPPAHMSAGVVGRRKPEVRREL